MKSTGSDQSRSRRLQKHWAFRYGLAVALFAATLGLSLAMTAAGVKLNFTIPIILALVITAWYGGLGPGILIGVLFQSATVIYTPIPAGTSLAQAIFGYFSVFSLLVFLGALISYLRRTQSNLREQRDILQVTLSALGDAVIASDSNGDVKFLNPAAQELTGFSAAEAVGQKVEHIARIVSDHASGYAHAPSERVLETRRAIGRTNHSSLIGKGGNATPVAYSAAPINFGDSSTGAVLVMSNVSAEYTTKTIAEKRNSEIAALYEFSHRSQFADSIDAVYEAALESMFLLLKCDRAAVLLFDEDGVMEFVAARGLSDDYQKIVSGHSPWTINDSDARAFGIENIAAAEIEAAIGDAIRKEGIAALGFIPLVSSEQLIGKLMVYFNEAHTFTEAEFEMAMTVGNQIAAGLERKRSEARLLENEERLRLATQTGKVGVWDWDIVAGRVEWTDAVYAMHGLEKDDFDGTVESFTGLVHPDDRRFLESRIKSALEGTQPYDLEFRIVRPDGKIGWLLTNAVVLRKKGVAYRMVGATTDITDQKKAEAVRRENEIMRRIVDAQEAERRRIARDLHDHLGQKMTALRLRMVAVSEECGSDPAATRSIRELQKAASSIDQDIGFLSWELRPTELESLGLVNALGTFVTEWSTQHGIEAEFQDSNPSLNGTGGRLDPEIELNLYRIAQEALNNVLKHAEASSVSVLVRGNGEKMRLIIEDNGRGFDHNSSSPDIQRRYGLGVIGMQERAALLNGTFEVETSPNKGTTVIVEIPVASAQLNGRSGAAGASQIKP